MTRAPLILAALFLCACAAKQPVSQALADDPEAQPVGGIIAPAGALAYLLGPDGQPVAVQGVGEQPPTAGTTAPPTVLGALDKGDIDAGIRAELAAIRGCYQAQLRASPALHGKLVAKFVITAEGTVSSSTTQTSTLGDEAVESCIHEVLMGLAFPEPRGGGVVIVSYPFVFSPE